jgi:hypothetical protein
LRKSLTKECGWKDGDRGVLAGWEQLGERKKKREETNRKKRKGLTLTGLLMVKRPI